MEDAYTDERFNRAIDQSTGYRSKSDLMEQRGKYFDPKLVDLFFQNIDTFVLNMQEKV